jgi:GTP-binding protein Era
VLFKETEEQQKRIVERLSGAHEKRYSLVIITLLIGFITFIAWAKVFNIDQVARAMGEVIASSRVQVIKAVDGGVLELLNVREGDRVQKGDVLAQLDQTRFGASVKEIEARLSALKAKGIEDLKTVLFENSEEGEKMYPDEFFTDQDPEFRAAEIIREKAINRVKEELPHAIYVEISDMEEAEDGKVLWIRAFLIVERESQKGIVVGKGGVGIKAIRVAAQKELNGIFPYRVKLDLRVKANSKWRKNDKLLKKLIY